MFIICCKLCFELLLNCNSEVHIIPLKTIFELVKQAFVMALGHCLIKHLYIMEYQV
ncbi:hypothetical protein IscW_ISCW005092 [Ixodes scapularis]|uniref:Uncharacterized protein n=1 Tax=Ixodes scapularis TaxID=6945 RepID=B7PIT0_IXOSC|nr:hypothetical protein IscW_ISCW005092 [Ixodes scapularis]|eukprot:XP_002406162.1 hypothetical protein IscW_ISCW005092 [Ixodes scapularis]